MTETPTIRLAGIVRETLLGIAEEALNPVDKEVVLVLARELMGNRGGSPDAIKRWTVQQEIGSILDKFGAPLTHDKVKQQMRDCHDPGDWSGPSVPRITNEEIRKPKKKCAISPTQAVRLALLECETPSIEGRKKICVLAQAKYVQEGGDANEISVDVVDKVLAKLRREFGKEFTAENVKSMHDRASNQRSKVSYRGHKKRRESGINKTDVLRKLIRQHPSWDKGDLLALANSTHPEADFTPKDYLNATAGRDFWATESTLPVLSSDALDLIRDARALCQRAGGAAKLIALLEVLEGGS